MWVFRRTKSGRRWAWEALIRLDVGAPMVFVSGDIQYVKWRKLDQIHVSLRLFLFPRTHTGLSERWGIFVDCNPLAVVADMLVLAASEHFRRIRDLCARPVEVLGLGGCLCYFDPCGLLWLG